MRVGGTRIVPVSSRTDALIPPPPQSMTRVLIPGSADEEVLTRHQCAVWPPDPVAWSG